MLATRYYAVTCYSVGSALSRPGAQSASAAYWKGALNASCGRSCPFGVPHSSSLSRSRAAANSEPSARHRCPAAPGSVRTVFRKAGQQQTHRRDHAGGSCAGGTVRMTGVSPRTVRDRSLQRWSVSTAFLGRSFKTSHGSTALPGGPTRRFSLADFPIDFGRQFRHASVYERTGRHSRS